ncbi:hypothetical protein [Sodalis sp. C49]|uniref:hypothetical protein n=1 Tax=Sodalis sp. C49 TaxID=3228929 RepID=UPI0039659571
MTFLPFYFVIYYQENIMHITGMNSSFFTKITSWNEGQVTLRTHVLTSVIKKLVNIRSYSARAAAKSSMDSEESYNALAEDDDSVAASESRNGGGSSPGRGVKSFIPAFVGCNSKRYDLSAAQKNRDAAYDQLQLKRHLPLELLHDRPVDRETFISQTAEGIVKEMKSGLLKEQKDKLEWKSNEFALYLPAQINKTIDQVMDARLKENKPLNLTPTFNRDIIQQAMTKTGIWRQYAHITRIENGSATSTVAVVRLYMNNHQMDCPDLIRPVADRVYERLFNCPGLVARVTLAAEHAIAQKLDNESRA